MTPWLAITDGCDEENHNSEVACPRLVDANCIKLLVSKVGLHQTLHLVTVCWFIGLFPGVQCAELQGRVCQGEGGLSESRKDPSPHQTSVLREFLKLMTLLESYDKENGG